MAKQRFKGMTCGAGAEIWLGRLFARPREGLAASAQRREWSVEKREFATLGFCW
ncbi:MAG: hypothetical protein ACREQW_21150 [Candidatus Binatia bacterium]